MSIINTEGAFALGCTVTSLHVLDYILCIMWCEVGGVRTWWVKFVVRVVQNGQVMLCYGRERRRFFGSRVVSSLNRMPVRLTGWSSFEGSDSDD